MLFLFGLAIALCILFLGGNSLKKHAGVFYVTGAVVTIVVITISQLVQNRTLTIENGFLRDYLIGVFSKGALAGALWAVVMWGGALPNGSWLIKKIMPIRGELSILAATVTLSHAVTYGITYLRTLSNNLSKGRPFTSDFVLTCIICIVLMLIMIPLTVMSFKAIRKKMNPKRWKAIQRTAYVFYALIYAHILVLYIPQAQKGRTEKFVSIIVYSIVFVGYAIFRLRKYYIMSKKPEAKAALNLVCTAAGVLLIGGVSLLSYGSAPERKQSESVKAVTAQTTSAEESASTTAVSGSSATGSAASTTTGTGTETTAVSSTSGTGSTTATGSTTSGIGTETTASAAEDEEKSEDETTAAAEEKSETEEKSDEPAAEEKSEETPTPTEAEPAPEPETEPEPEYIYNNGTFEGTGEGYTGSIHVTITIENDVITSIKGDPESDDPEYYDEAEEYVFAQIKANGSADGVDACSGATYSSEGLIAAAQQALASARR